MRLKLALQQEVCSSPVVVDELGQHIACIPLVPQAAHSSPQVAESSDGQISTRANPLTTTPSRDKSLAAPDLSSFLLKLGFEKIRRELQRPHLLTHHTGERYWFRYAIQRQSDSTAIHETVSLRARAEVKLRYWQVASVGEVDDANYTNDGAGCIRQARFLLP